MSERRILTSTDKAAIDQEIGKISEEIAEIKEEGGISGGTTATRTGALVTLDYDEGAEIVVEGETTETVTLVHCGKNLLPPLASAFTTLGVTFTPNPDGSFTLNGTYTGASTTWPDILSKDDPVYLPAGTYTFRAKTRLNKHRSQCKTKINHSPFR